MKGNLYIGTSGYVYSHWVGSFYPPELKRSGWFEYYASQFNSVEINYTFYHIPGQATLKKWKKLAPDGFIYVLKASRLITHTKKWNSAEYLLWKFLKLTEFLGDKCGPVLLQFPPSFADESVVERLLLKVKPPHRVAIEFRNATLLDSERIRKVLAGSNAAFCVASSPKIKPRFVVTADFVYIRFHGERQMYRSSYSDEELLPFAEFAKSQLADGRDVFAFFNNDAEGHAIHNAKRLKKLILLRKLRVKR